MTSGDHHEQQASPQVPVDRVRCTRPVGCWRGLRCSPLVAAAMLLALLPIGTGHAAGAAFQDQDVASTDAAFFRGVAENPTNPLEIRRVALIRLLSDPQSAGREAVLSLMQDPGEGVRTGLVAAFANAPVESPELAEALAAAAVASGPDDRGAWAGLLALAGPGMDTLLVELATTRRLPGELRGSAVELLGGFPTPLAAETLMAVAEAAPDEALRSAAFEALRRMSGMPFGDTVEAWRSWWAAGGEELLEATCEQRAETLAARLERADRDRRTARSLVDRAVEQLRQVHAEVLLGMAPAPRQERILGLLQNEFEPLRRLAVEQVERMLRNGDRIDDPGIPLAIEALLDDRAPALRAKAASVLGTLAPERVVELVSVRLPEERESQVANAYMAVVEGMVTPATLDSIVSRLDDPATAEAAARAIVRLHAAGVPDGVWRSNAAAAARLALESASSPAMVELLAIAGDDADDDRLGEFLRSDDPGLRRAIADGWGRRGRIEALRPYAADPVVYPALAAAVLAGRTPFEAIETMLELPRSEPLGPEFERVLTRLLDAMPLERIAEADRLLADAEPPISSELRRRGLRRVVEARAGEVLEPVFRVDAVERLGRLLLDADAFEDAVGLIRPQIALAPERLGPLLLEALLLGTQFDAAASREPEAAAWLAVLVSLGDGRLPQREAVGREIAKRFGENLDDAQWEELRRQVPSLGAAEQPTDDDDRAGLASEPGSSDPQD